MKIKGIKALKKYLKKPHRYHLFIFSQELYEHELRNLEARIKILEPIGADAVSMSKIEAFNADIDYQIKFIVVEK